ncbi:hypothetical protein RLOatenuis_3320 [Rickettsiales bacterium]|nr:hypothetical protein RLOatenuis_3320 [Rickettsiales bacterium]
MLIKDIPEYKDKKNNMLIIEESLSIYDAVEKMVERNFGAAIVAKNKKVIGMFTERDILKKVVAKRKDIESLKVSDVMTREVKVAREEDAIADLMRRMTQGRFRHLPIVDKEGNIINMLSQGDLVSYSWPRITKIFQRSFMANTQVWMMFIGILVYTVAILVVVKL